MVSLHPSSVLFSSSELPGCVVFSELVHTSRSYMRNVSAIETEWAIDIHPQLRQRLNSITTNTNNK